VEVRRDRDALIVWERTTREGNLQHLTTTPVS
jgi:hypothetical protein